MTLTLFNRLYKAYKDVFDLETSLQGANMTYAQLKKKAQQDELWF